MKDQLYGYSPFMNKPTKAALSAKTCLRISCQSRRERKLTSCGQVVNYLLSICATDKVIAKAHTDIMKNEQRRDLGDVVHLQSQRTKTLHFDPLYHKYGIKAHVLGAYDNRSTRVWDDVTRRTKEHAFRNSHDMPCHWQTFNRKARHPKIRNKGYRDHFGKRTLTL